MYIFFSSGVYMHYFHSFPIANSLSMNDLKHNYLILDACNYICGINIGKEHSRAIGAHIFNLINMIKFHYRRASMTPIFLPFFYVYKFYFAEVLLTWFAIRPLDLSQCDRFSTVLCELIDYFLISYQFTVKQNRKIEYFHMIQCDLICKCYVL